MADSNIELCSKSEFTTHNTYLTLMGSDAQSIVRTVQNNWLQPKGEVLELFWTQYMGVIDMMNGWDLDYMPCL